MKEPHLALIFDEDCPYVDEARRNLATAVRRVGAPVTWTEFCRQDPQTPLPLKEFGSPTVLVDGVDAVDPGSAKTGDACRLYRQPDGRTLRFPSEQQIEVALRGALFGASVSEDHRFEPGVDTRQLLGRGEIVGGNQNLDLEVTSCCVHASVFSRAIAGPRGGDVCYLSHCESDLVTRMAVADVQGHGDQVSRVSGAIFRFMRRHLNELENAGLLTDLNGDLFDQGLHGLTTAAVLSFHRKENRLCASIAGHPPPFVWRASTSKGWQRLRVDGPEGHGILLGVVPEMHYSSVAFPLAPGDRLFLFTDGLTEVGPEPDALVGEERLLRLLNRHSADDLVSIKRTVIGLLPATLADDATFMAVEIAM